MNEAKFKISAAILRDALELPPEIEVVGDDTGNVVLTMRSDLIPDGEEWAIPVWIKDGSNPVRFLKLDRERNPFPPSAGGPE